MMKRLVIAFVLANGLLWLPASPGPGPQDSPQTKKGGPPTQPNQGNLLLDPSSNPIIAASGGVEPLTPEQLQAFIPSSLAGMARVEIKGEGGQLGPGKMSFAFGAFAVSEERHVQLELFDRGGFPPNTHRPLPVPPRGETVKYLNYTVEGVEVAGFPAAQMQEGPARKLQVTAGRVRITLFSVGLEFKQLVEAAATLPLAKIAEKAAVQETPPPAPPE